MGSVAILMLIGIWFTWKYTDTFSVWLQRVRIWHDPAIVELQNVHSNHFFEGFMVSWPRIFDQMISKLFICLLSDRAELAHLPAFRTLADLE